MARVGGARGRGGGARSSRRGGDGDGGRVGGHYLRRRGNPSLGQEGWRYPRYPDSCIEVLLVELRKEGGGEDELLIAHGKAEHGNKTARVWCPPLHLSAAIPKHLTIIR